MSPYSNIDKYDTVKSQEIKVKAEEEIEIKVTEPIEQEDKEISNVFDDEVSEDETEEKYEIYSPEIVISEDETDEKDEAYSPVIVDTFLTIPEDVKNYIANSLSNYTGRRRSSIPEEVSQRKFQDLRPVYPDQNRRSSIPTLLKFKGARFK